MTVSDLSERLVVQLFGTPRVEGPSGTLALSPQQLTLTVLVYGHADPGLTRARAAELLWGGEPDPAARQRLRQLLSDLNRRAGQRLVATSGDRLLPAPGVGFDLSVFHRALEHAAPQEAAELVARGFARLPFDRLPDQLYDWRESTEARLERQVRVAASSMWASATAAGDRARAWSAAEALYLLDPDDPAAVERVIEARAHVGRVEEAEAAYATFVEVSDHRRVPDEIDTAIERARRLGRIATAEADGPDEVPLVGRAEALASARSIFDQLEAGEFGFVLISGESGIGKTRLLKEVRREAVMRDIRCLDAQAVELESKVPLTPLVDALRSVDLEPHLEALGRPWSAVIAAVLPAKAGCDPLADLPPIQDSALSRRLLDALYLLFERLAREQPTILFLDDLQWADATTVAALQFVQRRWTSGSLGVVATVRPELVGPSDPLASHLSRSADLPIRCIELGDLSAEEALALVHRIGSGRLSGEVAERISALAGPHPLYLTELTKDFLAGRLKLPALPADEVTIPLSLRELLEARISGLSPNAAKVAGLLAVGARPLSIEVLAGLTGLRLDSVAEAVDELRYCRLAAIDCDRASIAHELFRSAIYRHLGSATAAVNHKAIASLLENEPHEEAAGELALHYSRAGERSLAARYGWIAAERAIRTGASAEAAHLLQLVIASEDDPDKRAEATARRARALFLTRDMHRAMPLLEAAASQLRQVGRRSDAIRLDIHRIEALADLSSAQITDLLVMIRQAKEEAHRSGDLEAVGLALDAELHLLYRAGDVHAITTVFAEMRSLAEEGCLEATLLANAGLAMGILFGDPDEALLAGRKAVDLATPGKPYRLKALLRLMVVLQYRGMLALSEARAIVAEARQLAERSGDALLRFSIESNLAVALLDAGDLDRAEAMMIHSSALLGESHMALNRCNQANNWAELALAQGDYARAEELYREAISYMGPTTPGYIRELATAGLGLCALNVGNLAEARRSEGMLGPLPDRWYYDPTVGLMFRSRMLDLRGRSDEALKLLEQGAADVEDRLVLAWLKLQILRIQLMRRRGNREEASRIAADARRRAEALQLGQRARELALLARN